MSSELPSWLAEPPDSLSEAACGEWQRRAPTWAAAGHLQPIDVALLGIYAETLAMHRRTLEQTLADPDVSGHPVALEMLADLAEDIAKWRRELQLPNDDDRPP